MTSIVGVLCRDGAVIGADSSATFGAGQFSTIEQTTEKLQVVDGRVVVAGTGQVGLGQRFTAVVGRGINDLGVKHSTAIDCGKALCKAGLEDFAGTGVSKGQFGALVAFACKDAPHLCELAVTDFQPELKDARIWYASLGSAQMITDPFLGFLREVFWGDGPPQLQDGIFSVVWTLEQACRLNTGGVKEPIHVAILERNPEKAKGHPWIARKLPAEEIELHRQNVAAARAHLGAFRKQHQPEAAAGLVLPPVVPNVQAGQLPPANG